MKPSCGRSPFNEIFVGLALLASACISIVLTRVPGGIALFWPGSAIAAALLIRLPRVRWPTAAVSVLAALVIANVVVAHRPWLDAALFASVNLIKIALMVTAFRFTWRSPYPNITIGHAALMTAVFGIAIPGAAAILGGVRLQTRLGIRLLEGTLQCWSSHTVGACL